MLPLDMLRFRFFPHSFPAYESSLHVGATSTVCEKEPLSLAEKFFANTV